MVSVSRLSMMAEKSFVRMSWMPSRIIWAKSATLVKLLSSMSSSMVLMRSVTRPFHLRAHMSVNCDASSGTRVLPSSRSDRQSVKNFCVCRGTSFLISKSKWSRCLSSATRPCISVSASMNSSRDSVAINLLSILIFLLAVGGLYHKVFDFLISTFKVCKVVPSLRVNAFGCVSFGTANECVIDTAKMLFENFRFA